MFEIVNLIFDLATNIAVFRKSLVKYVNLIPNKI